MDGSKEEATSWVYPFLPLLGFIGKGVFEGNRGKICPSLGGGPNDRSSPNGVLTENAGLVWAGDGNSTIKVLKLTLNTGAVALITSVPTCPSGSDGCGTGGKFRADELSYDPVDNLILIAYDADNFLTFVHVDDAKPTNSAVVGHFFYADNTIGAAASLPGRATGNGLEQSVYVPQTRLFYQAVRGNTDMGAVGFIDVFDPTTMRLVDTFPVPGCDNGPTGLALGPNQRFLGACDNGAAAVEVRYGQLHKIVEGVGGADEIWFDRSIVALAESESDPPMTFWTPRTADTTGWSKSIFEPLDSRRDRRGRRARRWRRAARAARRDRSNSRSSSRRSDRALRAHAGFGRPGRLRRQLCPRGHPHRGRHAMREYVALLMREGRAGPPPNGEVAYRHFVGAPTIDNGDGKATVHVLHRLSGRFPGSQPVVTRS